MGRHRPVDSGQVRFQVRGPQQGQEQETDRIRLDRNPLELWPGLPLRDTLPGVIGTFGQSGIKKTAPKGTVHNFTFWEAAQSKTLFAPKSSMLSRTRATAIVMDLAEMVAPEIPSISSK